MTTGTVSGLLRRLRQAALARDGGGLTDGQLLERFLTRRDEAAFEALVRRHGPMVLGVCRRLLAHEHDAEDAFQATFLVLARKAASVVPRELVGNWLHGVACRTASKARGAAARRRVMERQVKAMPEPPTESADCWHDLRPMLDQELRRLPDKYRVPVVLCDLGGRTRRQAALQLGIPEGTLSSRLAAARKLLARRLARRGLAPATASLALALSPQAASACVPASLVGATVAAATRFAAGPAAAGAISANVAALAEAVLKTMWVTRLKVAVVVLLALSVLGAGATIITTRALAAEREGNARPRLEQEAGTAPVSGLYQADREEVPQDREVGPESDPKGPKNQKADRPKNPKDDDDDDDDDQKPQGVVKALDVSQGAITLTVRRKGEDRDQTFALAKNVRAQVAGKAASLADVAAGMRVVLRLSKEKKAVVEVKEAKSQPEKDGGPKGNKNAAKSSGGN